MSASDSTLAAEDAGSTDAGANGSSSTSTARRTPPQEPEPSPTVAPEKPELDDFGLPIKKFKPVQRSEPKAETDTPSAVVGETASSNPVESPAVAGDVDKMGPGRDVRTTEGAESVKAPKVEVHGAAGDGDDSDEQEFRDAMSTPQSAAVTPPADAGKEVMRTPVPMGDEVSKSSLDSARTPRINGHNAFLRSDEPETQTTLGTEKHSPSEEEDTPATLTDVADQPKPGVKKPPVAHSRDTSHASDANGLGLGISEYSHQQLTTNEPEKKGDDDDEWQIMPAYAPYDIYDDDNRLVAKEYDEAADEKYGYAGLGGAGKGYTRVLIDDDAESATSMDDNTQYLFNKNAGGTSMMEDDETQRDAVSQLQATKDLLTEGQRIAYVGLTRLELSTMIKDIESIQPTKKTKKDLQLATENTKMWSQKMMIRLYSHMEISPAEQVMIEQLADHGVVPKDLTPVLMANARVKNPMAEEDAQSSLSGAKSPQSTSSVHSLEEQVAEPPPAYEVNNSNELAAPVQMPSQMTTDQKIDIDLRWTVLCDLFLVLIADSIYDSRSRVLLERVGADLEIPWVDICRFEKKVTDALEMQQQAEKENWNEEEHMETRRKLALRRRYVMMGLATVGGGLVIGLSAGLLAPMIGAGLAAGFTTIGVSGTSSFLAGAGGAAIITSGAASAGGIIGGKAANRRTGAVKTFEYRPLHNNKRVNLIISVSGWMTGKVDDVRLPFSTVDPVMGDIYSVLWEPEMLSSMGDTINILATEALTQGLQQILGSTILISLMAALQLPVVLTKLAYLIDNPWAVSLDRATMAGLILADSLIDRNLGTRPITLVGYSLGSRVIFSCLQELARKGAYGLIQNVYMFGSPIVVKQDEYIRARSVVSGRFVSGYNTNDWILGYLFRLTNGGIRRVAGLAPIEGVAGVENFNCTEHVVGHMDYRTAMPRLLRECGWLVESDEFSEIEDPDPENHNERQRELITEIEEARKELEKEGNKANKGGFAFWRRKKTLEKQEWELYDDSKGPAGANGNGNGKTEDNSGNNHGLLFDVDAMRAELAKDHAHNEGEAPVEEELFQVKEIKSTLPPMKLDLPPSSGVGPAPTLSQNPRGSLRETKSMDMPSYRSSYEYRPSGARTPSYSSKPGGGDYYHTPGYGNDAGFEEDETQMTFETSYNDKNQVKAASESAAPPSRPEYKPTQTVPNITLNDPWADEVDDEMGKEKEITMTFA